MSNDEGICSVKLIQIAAPDFDLEKTLNSGQVFHWEKIDSGFCGTIGNVAAYLEQRGDALEGGAPATPDWQELVPPLAELVRHYFALDHSLAQICASFPDDKLMNTAREFCRGLRIIRQPKWECLATFICSPMKQVAHIRQISRKLRERFGEALEVCDQGVYTFPPAERVAQASEKQLRECRLGYRAKNLLATARLAASGDIDLEKIATLSDADLRAALCALPGVGPKVANCVMLFAYERLGAFPIDVWIERVLREKYFARKRKVTTKRLRDFSANYFGAHGGYAQQYLFHHARMTGRRRGKGQAGEICA